MRRCPPPLSVTLPPPSSTTRAAVFTTFAVAAIVITTAAGPHEKVMTPPLATAATTAADVQLSAVPLPTTVLGCDVSTACPAAGTVAWPSGLPNDADVAAVALVVDVVAVVADDAAADDAEEDDAPRAGVPLVTVGVVVPKTGVLATGPPCSRADEPEPQAAVPISKATATSAWLGRKSARLEDTRRD